MFILTREFLSVNTRNINFRFSGRNARSTNKWFILIFLFAI